MTSPHDPDPICRILGPTFHQLRSPPSALDSSQRFSQLCRSSSHRRSHLANSLAAHCPFILHLRAQPTPPHVLGGACKCISRVQHRPPTSCLPGVGCEKARDRQDGSTLFFSPVFPTRHCGAAALPTGLTHRLRPSPQFPSFFRRNIWRYINPSHSFLLNAPPLVSCEASRSPSRRRRVLFLALVKRNNGWSEPPP